MFNSNNISVNEKKSRAEWMLELCDNLFAFYDKEVVKIAKRIEHFKKVKKKWVAR
jgi:hypothetical protein